MPGADGWESGNRVFCNDCHFLVYLQEAVAIVLAKTGIRLIPVIDGNKTVWIVLLTFLPAVYFAGGPLPYLEVES